MSQVDSILVVDDDAGSRPNLESTLASAGLDCTALDSAESALHWLQERAPRLVLLNLAALQSGGYSLLRHIRSRPHLADVPVVVLSEMDADAEIQRIFASGADDYVHRPFRPSELVSRIRGQMRLRDYVDRLSRRERNAQTVLELTQALASSLDIRDILFTVVKRIAAVANVDRCSIVLVGESGEVGYVVATSDDEHLRDLPIALERYPEIRQVMRTGETLVIPDVDSHPLLEEVRQNETGFEFSSLAIVPILHDRGPTGVIFLRSRGHSSLAKHEMAMVRTVSHATAIALRNARLLQNLRDESRQSTFARIEAERRVQLFQRYADLFESAADGMVVLDRNETLLFSNPRAREILGYTELELIGTRFSDLLADDERPRAKRLLRGFSAGIYPRSVDVRVKAELSSHLMISGSFSSVLRGDDAVLFSFRDVTLERRTAVELKQTKEFLERVIDSSVDAIVSCDLEGRVLLFNRAAARLFGYDPSEVMGRIGIEELYPHGQARSVMRRIVDPRVSGPRRLEGHRTAVLDANGTRVPVSVSAALVMENGRPAGSVGIFTDLREALRMAERLDQAHEELRTREQQAIVAELAGTAAHELNQPLTSVIGYAELLRRGLEDNPQLSNAARVIISESERMAEIVRKIGKITRWETKDYVGDAKILDLEKASPDPNSKAYR